MTRFKRALILAAFYIAATTIGAILPRLVFSATAELSQTVKAVQGLEVVMLAVTVDDPEGCSGLCYSWGGHVGRVFTASNNYTLAGLDLYAKISGEKISQRWGIGFSLFNKQTEELNTPWDFRISMQTSYLIWGDAMRIFLELMHWSNCRGCIENTPLVDIWPEENNGGDSLSAGLSWVF